MVTMITRKTPSARIHRTPPYLLSGYYYHLRLFLGFRIGTADIKGAFLQSGPIRRYIFVRPPREWPRLRGRLWKLLKLPYGITDAGRQWQVVVEDWMLTQAGVGEKLWPITTISEASTEWQHMSFSRQSY